MIALGLLSVRRLLERPLVVILSIVGISAGVALTVAVDGVLTSLQQSIDELGTLDRDADLEISARSPLGFDEALAIEALRDPAVIQVIPQLRQPVMINNEAAIVLGRPDIPMPMAGRGIAGVSGPTKVALHTSAGVHNIVVRPAPPALTDANDGQLLLLPLQQAQELTGRQGLIDVASIVIQSEADPEVGPRLERQLGPSVYLAPANATQDYALNQMKQVQQPLVLMALIALIAGGFLVFNTIQTSARQREREVATLRALGGSKAQVSVGLLMEAVVLGIVGTALGLAGGVWLGRTVVNALPDIVSTAAGVTVRYHFDPRILPQAVIAGLGVAIVSALLPIRQLLKTKPNQVLQGRTVRRSEGSRRSFATVGFGVVVLLIGGVMATSRATEMSQNGVGLLLLGFLAVGYGLIRPIASLTGRVAVGFGPLGELVQADARSGLRRIWSVAAAVFVAVAMYLTVGGSARNQIDTTFRDLEVTTRTDVWITSARSDDLPLGFYYRTSSTAELASLPGVQSVSPETISYAVRDNKRFGLIGTGGVANYPVFVLAGPEAVSAVIRGEGAVITTQYARAFDLEIGDLMELDGVNGPMTFPVVGVSRTVSVSNFGTVIISRDRYVELLGDPGVSGFQISLDDDADAAAVQAAAVRILTGPAPVEAGSGDSWRDEAVAVTQTAADTFLVVLMGVAGVAAIATFNATVSSVVERKRQLGIFRSLGATRRQIQKLVLIEVGSTGLVGATIGFFVGTFMHWVGVKVTNRSTPFPSDYAFDWPTAREAAVAAVVAMAFGALIPAWTIGRGRIADALAYE